MFMIYSGWYNLGKPDGIVDKHPKMNLLNYVIASFESIALNDEVCGLSLEEN